MVNFIKNKFFTKQQCDLILSKFMENGKKFSYDNNKYDGWDCRLIDDDVFKKYIINSVTSVFSNNEYSHLFNYNLVELDFINISLTRYYDDKWLDLHLDKSSLFKTVISLTDEYYDGRFILSNNYKSISNLDDTDIKLSLGLGEGVTFKGNTIFHGVMPVTNGIRCALNIWMKDCNIKTLI